MLIPGCASSVHAAAGNAEASASTRAAERSAWLRDMVNLGWTVLLSADGIDGHVPCPIGILVVLVGRRGHVRGHVGHVQREPIVALRDRVEVPADAAHR